MFKNYKRMYIEERGERASCELEIDFFKRQCKTYEAQTDGLSEQHVGVLNRFAASILRGEQMVAGGEEGINGLTLSNAMHLSAFLGKPVELPFDEDLYESELMKRVATSRRKEAGKSVFSDTTGTY